jgi:hypothetical protein
MENSLEKTGAVAVEHLKNEDYMQFKIAFDTAARNYIRKTVHEESVAEKILEVVTVDREHPKIQIDADSDSMYYLESIETGAIACEVSIRGEWLPRFVDGERYKIYIGKIESEPVKKPQLELMVANELVKMVKENNAEQIRRTQDVAFMRAVKAAVTANTAYIGGDNADGSTSAIDWSSTGPVKLPLVNLMGKITYNELVPAKWLMTETMWNQLAGMDAGEIGDLAGELLTGGMGEGKTLLKLPVVTTIKSKLADGTLGGQYFFDYRPSSTTLISNIYLFTDPGYLGKIVKVGTDNVWSKWEKDVFHWNSWRYVGLGFGDTRGIARLRVKLA